MTDEIEMYVTNTETVYYTQNNNLDDVAVRFYGRTRAGDDETITIKGYEPYFYVPADETDLLKPQEHEHLVRYEESDLIPLADRFDHITPGMEPRKLAKAVITKPSVARQVRQHWDRTWSADVDFANRLRIDKGIKTGVRAPSSECHHSEIEPVTIEDVDPRVVFFDIETDDRGEGFPAPGEARILSIAAYDSYDGELVTFLDTNGKTTGEFFNVDEPQSLADLGLNEPDELITKGSERQMLMEFANWIDDCDPDIITGWNSGDDREDGFDLPHLVERMKAISVNPRRLSREGYVNCEEYNDDWTVSIRGRTTYDLMDAWAGTKFTKPDSKRLDDVAASSLDDAKIPHTGQGYFEMYEDSPQKFIDYNTKDTRLTVEIDEAENVFGFKKRLRDMIGVDWEETRENNQFISMSVRRKCREQGVVMITAWDNPHVREAAKNQNDGVNYEGAYVFPAFRGLKRNVVGKDLASLYPMTQAMLNASPDTKINRKVAFKHDIPHVIAENGACFRTDVDSIIRELVDEYDELKMEFKRKKKKVEYGTEEYERLDEAYGTTKTVYNCVTGDHEVMTADGAVNIKDVEVGDEVYSLNPSTGLIEMKPVTETHHYPDYSGDLIEIDTTNISQTLTPNHQTIVKQNDGYVQDESYSLVEAGDLTQSVGYEMPTPAGSDTRMHGPGMDTMDLGDEEVLRGAEVRVYPDCHGRTFRSSVDVPVEYDDNTSGYFINGDDYFENREAIESLCKPMTTEIHPERNMKFVPLQYDGDAFVRLLGWYITEGSVYTNANGSTRVNIAQREAGDVPAVQQMFEDCGIDYHTDEMQVWFTSGILGPILGDVCGKGSENKHVPEFSSGFSGEQKRILFQTLMAGDGDVNQNRYTTKSKRLRDDFMQLATELGQTVRYSYDESFDGWRVRYGEPNNHFRMNRSSERRESEPDEGVYCLTVADNHTMLCGRDGTFSWTGNSYYGYTGWDKSPLYDPEIAAAVTLTGQVVIKNTAEYINSETVAEVAYGDTDSVPAEEPVLVKDESGDIDYIEIQQLYGVEDEYQVWTEDGFTNIKKVWKKPNRKQNYTIRTKNGLVHTTEDHSLVRNDGSMVKPGEVAEGDHLLHRDVSEAIKDGSETMSTDRAWLYGFFAADGSAGIYDSETNGYTVKKHGFAFNKNDTDLLERAKSILWAEFGVNSSIYDYRVSSGVRKLQLTDNDDMKWGGVNEFIDHFVDICYTESREKHVPRSVLNGTDEIVEAFLDGYMGGDGYVGERYSKRFHEASTKDLHLASGLTMLLQRLGYTFNIDYRRNHDSEYYRLRCQQYHRGSPEKLCSVEEYDYNGEYVYDIETENHHFQAGAGNIIVHNSNYVEYPHDWDQERVLEYASEICDTLNDEVYPDLCNQFNIDPSENRWFIELEMLASDFFQSGGKKFYAYKSIWNEGMDFDAVVNGGDGKINISGYACQKSNFSEITKTTQKDVLTTILEGGSKQDVADIMFAAANSIDPANPDWESIGMPQGLGQKIDREKAGGDEYYDWSSKGDHPQQAHARGAWFANHLLDVNYGQDDQPKRVYIKPELTVNGESVDVICFEKEHDLEPIKDRIKVDLTDKNMQEKVLVNPMDDILDAFGMEMEAAMMGQAQTQSQLGAF